MLFSFSIAWFLLRPPQLAIEQDHRGIKSRTRSMLGFKNYDCAATTIAGIELLHRIRKNQFAFGQLRLKRHVRARSLERSPCDIADASSGALLSLIQICTKAIESVYPQPSRRKSVQLPGHCTAHLPAQDSAICRRSDMDARCRSRACLLPSGLLDQESADRHADPLVS
jgi:hypothetical protein